MIWNRIRSYLIGFSKSDRIVNKIADSKPIREAARIAAYSLIRITDTIKRKKLEYERQGGHEKMKQVTKDDLKKGFEIAKEMVTYDIPETIKKIIRDLNPKNRPRRD